MCREQDVERLFRTGLRLAVLVTLLSGGLIRAQGQDAATVDIARLSVIDNPAVYFGDFKQFMTAPAHWTGREWALLGGTLAATAVAYQYDYEVREHFVTDPHPTDYHDVEDFVPVALMVGANWFTARRSGDGAKFAETNAMVRAGILSTTSTLVFKLGLGRERPAEGVERDDWWSGGRSMPSGHTALAFSVGTVFAETGTPKHRWVRRTLGYGLGVGMAYLRLDHDSHWFSDTIAGAALGMAAGHFVLNHDNPAARRAQVFATPLEGGVLLAFSIALE
jgi:membrane-associated phospholipid phosphatase